MGNALLKAPVWAVGVVSGVIWTLGMLVLPSARGSRPGLVVVVVGGALFGTFMALLARRQRRRNFTVGGRELSGAERAAVVRAVTRGEPLADDRLRVAARRYAERFHGQPQRWWPLYVVFGAMTCLSVWLAVTGSPWWWTAVVYWPVGGWLVVWHARRQRATVKRYLDRTADPEPARS